MPSTPRLIVSLIHSVLVQAIFVGAGHHHSYIGGYQQRGGWGLQNHAVITPSSQRQILNSYLIQLRGGSDYPEDRDYANYKYGDYKDEYSDDRRGKDIFDDYDDQGRPALEPRGNPLATIQNKFKNGDRRIGVPLLGLGMVFTIMGVSLFFNKSLMRLGNLMFIAGVPMTIGPSRTAGYFFQPEKMRASACLFAGIFLVFVGWPILGMALEVFGILNLFGNMFPMFWAIFKNMPIVSSIVNSGSTSGRRQASSYRDYNYERDPYGDDERSGYDLDDYYNDDRRRHDSKDRGIEQYY